MLQMVLLFCAELIFIGLLFSIPALKIIIFKFLYLSQHTVSSIFLELNWICYNRFHFPAMHTHSSTKVLIVFNQNTLECCTNRHHLLAPLSLFRSPRFGTIVGLRDLCFTGIQHNL